MLFSEHFFLIYFFPIFLSVYLFIHFTFRSFFKTNVFLVIGSLFFYSTFGLNSFTILLIPILFDFFLGILVQNITNPHTKKFLFFIGVFCNFLLLGYFKYSVFIAEQILLFKAIPIIQTFVKKDIILPVGISFITFQRISYLTDIYRKKIKACTNIVEYACYALLFPHLIAGPIVRYTELAQGLKKRLIHSETFFHGLKYFAVGLFLKIFVADQFFLVDEFLTAKISQLDSFLSFCLIMIFSLRLYFDFLGYSLMAVGIAYFLGFHFPDNFNSPYSADSLTDFWRKWNISLSSWIRDYIYIPLGGNRVHKVRILFNLMITMIFAGIWHGAGWNFLAWGALHGVWLCFERLITPLQLSRFFHRRFRQLVTFFGVSFLWVIFRYTDWAQTKLLFFNLFQFTYFDFDMITHNTLFAALPALVVAAVWIVTIKEVRLRDIQFSPWKLFAFSLLLFFSIFFSLTKRRVEFIYFQF